MNRNTLYTLVRADLQSLDDFEVEGEDVSFHLINDIKAHSRKEKQRTKKRVETRAKVSKVRKEANYCKK